MPKTINICPCGSNQSYANCCEPLHLGKPASHPEALMRSRYTAYTLGLEQYLLDTWHKNTRPNSLGFSDDATTKWLGLEVKRVEIIDEDMATVEFIARYKVGGDRAQRLHEISQFKRTDRWYYLSGLIS